jgi:hypothetical protein
MLCGTGKKIFHGSGDDRVGAAGVAEVSGNLVFPSMMIQAPTPIRLTAYLMCAEAQMPMTANIAIRMTVPIQTFWSRVNSRFTAL